MFGFLTSAEMLGRLFGGVFQYTKEIPAKKRYGFTKFVYVFYDAMDTCLLFLPYPFMIVNRFLCGGLGASSATIRQAAVQSYLPQNMRARVNALFSVVFAIGGIVFQLTAGIIGLLLPYQIAAALLGLLTMISVFLFIILPKQVNGKVYEAERISSVI